MRRLLIVASVIAGFLVGIPQLEASGPKTETVKFWVSVKCASCQQKIMDNIPFEKGVKDVKVDLSTKIVEVMYDAKKTDSGKIRVAIEKLGFEVKSPEAAQTAAPAATTPAHKCAGQKDPNHKCTQEGAAVKAQEHKCQGDQEKKAESSTATEPHQCSGQKAEGGAATEPHKCTHEKK